MMIQGSRSILEYHVEFQTVISQIGEDVVDMDWARIHFERGLPPISWPVPEAQRQ